MWELIFSSGKVRTLHILPSILNFERFFFQNTMYSSCCYRTLHIVLYDFSMYYALVVVTLYATLGDDAIAHGINETEVTTVITSYDLMPKFQKILEQTPRVNALIYMEDQLKELDTSGYKEGVNIIKFSDVLANGAKSNIGKR